MRQKQIFVVDSIGAFKFDMMIESYLPSVNIYGLMLLLDNI